MEEQTLSDDEDGKMLLSAPLGEQLDEQPDVYLKPSFVPLPEFKPSEYGTESQFDDRTVFGHRIPAVLGNISLFLATLILL